MNEKNIVSIDAVIDRIKVNGYIDCIDEVWDYADDYEYKNILYYLEKYKDLQSKIDKANELLQEILVVRDWEHEGRFRPVKNTTAQDVYKTIVKLNELLETPRRINYELLKEDK